MLSIANGYKSGWIGENIEYIGRENSKLGLEASIFANPFSLFYYSREESIAKYRIYLATRLYKALSQNKDKVLLTLWEHLKNKHKEADLYFLTCYCYPKECHAEILVEFISHNLALTSEEFLEYLLEQSKLDGN